MSKCFGCGATFDPRGLKNHASKCPGGGIPQGSSPAADLRLVARVIGQAKVILFPFGYSISGILIALLVVWPWLFRAFHAYIMAPVTDSVLYVQGFLVALVSAYEFFGIFQGSDPNFSMRRVVEKVLDRGLGVELGDRLITEDDIASQRSRLSALEQRRARQFAGY